MEGIVYIIMRTYQEFAGSNPVASQRKEDQLLPQISSQSRIDLNPKTVRAHHFPSSISLEQKRKGGKDLKKRTRPCLLTVSISLKEALDSIVILFCVFKT